MAPRRPARTRPPPGCRWPRTRNAMDGMRHRRPAACPRRARRRTAHRRHAARGTDDRLALLFACCHPALAPEARLALTLRAVVGLTTPQIARAFLVHETTLAQRIVRAKRKIVSAHIALTVPPESELSARLGDVLAVVYVMFNEGFVSSTGATQDRDLAADAVWLAGVVATALPDEAEAWGLAALLTIQHARSRARFDGRRPRPAARPGPQPVGRAGDRGGRAADRTGGLPATARALPAAGRDRGRARDRRHAGPRPTGCRSPCSTTSSPATTRHPSSGSTRRSPTPRWPGPPTPWRGWSHCAEPLAGYHLFHAARAELLTALGRDEEAQTANRRALELTSNDAERRLLTTRLHSRPLDDGS